MVYPYNASFNPDVGGTITFGLLVDPPTREVVQEAVEQIIPGSATNDVVVDLIGRPTKKIKGKVRVVDFGYWKAFEDIVGQQGLLTYSEEVTGITVLLMRLVRTRVVPVVGGNPMQLGDVEFWIIDETP